MSLANLRQSAIKALRVEAEDANEFQNQSAQELIHELRVRQLELEMQNDELRRVQLDLEESRDWFVSLFDLAPVGYVTIDAANRIVDANLAVSEILGVDRSKLRGTVFNQYVTVEDSDLLHFHLRAIADAGHKTTCELQMTNTDGRIVSVRLDSRGVGAKNRLIAVIDLTEKIDLALAKQESDERLRVICQTLPIPMAYLDRSGNYQLCNAAHQEWVGRSVVGCNVSECFDVEVFEVVQRQIDHVLNGKGCSCRLRLYRNTTDLRLVEMHLAPHRDTANNVVGFYELIQDLSLKEHVAEAEAHRALLDDQLKKLSRRQRAVFDSLMAGKSNKLIASELDLGNRTVERLRYSILQLLEAESMNELLVRFATIVSSTEAETTRERVV